MNLLGVTILLGRAAGPTELGVLSLALASGSIMQAVSVAGLSSVAIAALLTPANDRNQEMRNIAHARFLVIPVIFACGSTLTLALPGIEHADTTALMIFFVGYAIGSFDVAYLSHTAMGQFHKIARRRIVLILLMAPITLLLAFEGSLNGVLVVLALQSALWQIVLIPGSKFPSDVFGYFAAEWKKAVGSVWAVKSLWIASVVGSVAQRIDLFIVSALLGVFAVGQYSTASRPVEATTMVAGSLMTILFNSMAISSGQPLAYSKNVARASKVMFCVALLIGLLLFLAGPLAITLLYGPEFTPAANILPIYAIGVLFIFQKLLLDRISVIEKQYRFIMFSSIFTIIVNIILNFALIPTLGLYGAALASVLTHPISLLLVFIPSTTGRCMLALTYGGLLSNHERLYKRAKFLVSRRD